MITITCDVDGCDESKEFAGPFFTGNMSHAGWMLYRDKYHLGPKHAEMSGERIVKANAAADETRTKVLADDGLSFAECDAKAAKLAAEATATVAAVNAEAAKP